MWPYIEGVLLFLKKHIRRLMLPRTISNDKILTLPLVHYEGEIVFVDSIDKAKLAVCELMDEGVLGFDTESKPSFVKGQFNRPSLLQLARKNRVYLFQLEKISGIDHIRTLLESGDILKIGVAVDHDISRLKSIAPFEPHGFRDLGMLSKKLGIIHTGLRNLTGIFLKKRLSKSAQLSDWSKVELSEKQKMYAATDAWVSILLYHKMREFE